MHENLWTDRVAALPVTIDRYHLEPLAAETAGGWVRHTTVIRMRGAGHSGCGEDVIYDADAQRAFQAHGATLRFDGVATLGELADRLDALEPWVELPSADRHYRRWAFESAALDLALRQGGRSFAALVGRTPRPLTFVASLGLGQPPDVGVLDDLDRRAPGARFKIDFANDWTEATVDALAARAERIAVVDLKGQYRGAFRGPDADAAMYGRIAAMLPDAWIEDPALDPTTDPVLAPFRERITWDAILHEVPDLERLPFPSRCINVKPSRFGSLRELLGVYAFCEERRIAMYGGGQFELGPGRRQIQALAALFHPDAPNDVAPTDYNAVPLPARLPRSPLATPLPGFGSDGGPGAVEGQAFA